MEHNKKKCSNKKHIEVNAISYCKECNKNVCNKCSIYHELFNDQISMKT